MARRCRQYWISNCRSIHPYSDFYTIDVADYIGKPPQQTDLDQFLKQNQSLVGEHSFTGLSSPIKLTAETMRTIASKYLAAILEAGRVYQHIAAIKGDDSMIVEVSMDETDKPQTPVELFVILAALASRKFLFKQLPQIYRQVQ